MQNKTTNTVSRAAKPARGRQKPKVLYPDKPISSEVNEAVIVFNPVTHALSNYIVKLMPEKKQYGAFSLASFSDFLADKLLIVRVIQKGIPYSVFSLIQKITPFTTQEWADYLGLSTKSMGRYQAQNTKFKPIHSEKIIEIAEVINQGITVFGTTEKFSLWLHTPNFAIGSNKPIELLRNSYGKDIILAELTRIEHGILS